MGRVSEASQAGTGVGVGLRPGELSFKDTVTGHMLRLCQQILEEVQVPDLIG